jgi:hypothetical protein
MPRRGGKAAGRRARHRPPRRPVIRQPELGVQAPPPARREDVTGPDDEATAVPPVGTLDAREATSLNPPKPALPPVYAGSSRLTERAAAEYHYVVRDLRNIAVLTVVLVVLLAVATLVFPTLGLVSR